MDAGGEGSAARRSRNWLVGLLLTGLALRVVAAWLSPGICHPDEHQQYLEQAFRLVHGYGDVFWEQERGMRHPLFFTLLGGGLWLCERVGVTDPQVQAGLLRLLVGLLSYGAMAYLAWTVYRQGQWIAGLALAFMLAASVDLAFIQVRTLSETAATVGLALALAWWPRRPGLAGVALGLMVTLRLQTAPLALGLWTAGAWAEWRGTGGKTTAWLTAGLAVTLLAAGLHDFAFYGSFFHSFRANVAAQWLESGASQFGVSPPDRYVVYGAKLLLRASVFAGVLFVWGAWRRPDLGWCTFLFVLAHTLIPHKETRFLWPLAPLACLMAAVGLEDLYRRGWFRRRWALACLAASLLLASGVRVGFVQWRDETYTASSWALTEVGRREDLRGVALADVPRCWCGNHFFLRRPVPIEFLSAADLRALDRHVTWSAGKVNYLVARRGSLPLAVASEVASVAESGDWVVYRRKQVDGPRQAGAYIP